MSDRTIGKKSSRLSSLSSSSPSPDKSPNHKKHKDSEDCSICFEEIKKGQKIKTLGCTHKFHDECINEWINGQRRVHLDPTCPNCRAIIPPPPPPPPPPRRDLIGEDIVIVDEYEAEHNGDSMPFLGIIVLYRNGRNRLNYLKTYLNTDLGLTLDSNLGDFKNAILTRGGELAVQCPIISLPRAGVLLNNLVSQPRQASFEIQQMYFGTPAGIDNIIIAHDYPGDIHSRMPYIGYDVINNYHGADNDNMTLEAIYREYRVKAEYILGRGQETFYRTRINGQEVGFSPLKHVFNKKLHYENGRGGVDIANVDYFYNLINPDIPERFRPQGPPEGSIWRRVETPEVLKKSTKIPLAWMIVEVGCHLTLSGGKTRRNKLRRKQNKSRRRIIQTTR